MKEHEWDYEALEREAIKTLGELRVASLLKRGYGNTVAGVIAEFDRVANDAEKAQKFVNDMVGQWVAVRGPNGEYFAVEMDEWDQVVEHIHSVYPNTKFPSFLSTQAHKSGLSGVDPKGVKYDQRKPR
jgi:hypothetical protein